MADDEDIECVRDCDAVMLHLEAHCYVFVLNLTLHGTVEGIFFSFSGTPHLRSSIEENSPC